ncbi:Swarming motility protein SwrC [bacterium HR39]|nr:Swarming motility protein SwrC [bacterium HR39]
MLRGPPDLAAHTQDLARLPVVLPDGTVVEAGGLADVGLWAGPVEIRRIDRARTVSLEIRPPADVPLETAMRLLEERVIAPLAAEGLPEGVAMRLSGTADRLAETFRALRTDLLLAVAIVFLAMAASFESLRIPLAVMVAVPLGAAGGVIGLVLVDRFVHPQPLDMLTMLGFVILVGVVVNNAILLADRVQRRLAEPGVELREALGGAVRDRLRTIFMTTLTSVFGMLPLVVAPGAGSELYRGIGAVVVGGLALSSVFVLFTVPPLLNLVLPRRVRAEEPAAAPEPAGAAGAGATGR